MDFCLFSLISPYYSPKPSQNNPGKLTVVVRMAQLNDIKGLAEVLIQSFHSPQQWFSWLQPVFKLGIYEDFRHRFKAPSPYYCCLVATVPLEVSSDTQESIIGTVEINLRPEFNSKSLYISNLAVSHGYRRRGVARHLLLKCEQIAREWGYQSLILHVLEDNHSAKNLYLNSGYQLQSRQITWQSWLFKSPQRLLLQKKIDSSDSTKKNVK